MLSSNMPSHIIPIQMFKEARMESIMFQSHADKSLGVYLVVKRYSVVHKNSHLYKAKCLSGAWLHKPNTPLLSVASPDISHARSKHVSEAS